MTTVLWIIFVLALVSTVIALSLSYYKVSVGALVALIVMGLVIAFWTGFVSFPSPGEDHFANYIVVTRRADPERFQPTANSVLVPWSFLGDTRATQEWQRRADQKAKEQGDYTVSTISAIEFRRRTDGVIVSTVMCTGTKDCEACDFDVILRNGPQVDGSSQFWSALQEHLEHHPTYRDALRAPVVAPTPPQQTSGTQ